MHWCKYEFMDELIFFLIGITLFITDDYVCKENWKLDVGCMHFLLPRHLLNILEVSGNFGGLMLSHFLQCFQLQIKESKDINRRKTHKRIIIIVSTSLIISQFYHLNSVKGLKFCLNDAAWCTHLTCLYFQMER